jgi:hypothetical protein
VRVGWRGDLYALSDVSNPESDGPVRLIRIGAEDSEVDTLVEYDGAWKGLNSEHSLALDNEGHIWVAEVRGDGQEQRWRISAYSPSGTLERRKTLSDTYDWHSGFVRTEQGLTAHLVLSDGSTRKRRLFSLSDDGITRIATLKDVAGQVCAEGDQLYHMRIPDDFQSSEEARPALVVRPTDEPNRVVEERELSEVKKITDEPVGQRGHDTRCRIFGDRIALFPASVGQRFSNWGCFAPTSQGASVECIEVDNSMSPNVVAVTQTQLLAAPDSLIDLGSSSTPSIRESEFETTGIRRGSDRSTLVQELRGIAYGVAPDERSILRIPADLIGSSGRLQVIDDDNTEITSILPGQRQLFVIAQDTDRDTRGTVIHTVYDETGKD